MHVESTNRSMLDFTQGSITLKITNTCARKSVRQACIVFLFFIYFPVQHAISQPFCTYIQDQSQDLLDLGDLAVSTTRTQITTEYSPRRRPILISHATSTKAQKPTPKHARQKTNRTNITQTYLNIIQPDCIRGNIVSNNACTHMSKQSDIKISVCSLLIA